MILPPPTSTLFPYTTLFRSMTTSTTSIDIMGLQAAYANLHTDQERDYFMQRYHDVITFLVSIDRKSGSAGMPRPISYAVFCLKKKNNADRDDGGRCIFRASARRQCSGDC